MSSDNVLLSLGDNTSRRYREPAHLADELQEQEEEVDTEPLEQEDEEPTENVLMSSGEMVLMKQLKVK